MHPPLEFKTDLKCMCWVLSCPPLGLFKIDDDAPTSTSLNKRSSATSFPIDPSTSISSLSVLLISLASCARLYVVSMDSNITQIFLISSSMVVFYTGLSLCLLGSMVLNPPFTQRLIRD
jgi:hypothetical protein